MNNVKSKSSHSNISKTGISKNHHQEQASNKIKCKADDKWHWLKEYASSREEDTSAKIWVAEHASRCPTCRTAIERTEGCFHIHCTFCGTHFCYECGDEIRYPFYGTHHCWEEGILFDEL